MSWLGLILLTYVVFTPSARRIHVQAVFPEIYISMVKSSLPPPAYTGSTLTDPLPRMTTPPPHSTPSMRNPSHLLVNIRKISPLDPVGKLYATCVPADASLADLRSVLEGDDIMYSDDRFCIQTNDRILGKSVEAQIRWEQAKVCGVAYYFMCAAFRQLLSGRLQAATLSCAARLTPSPATRPERVIAGASALCPCPPKLIASK